MEKKQILSIAAILAIALGALLYGCSPKIVSQSTQKESSDSVRVEYRTRIQHDTVTVPVPEYHERIITKDTASFLESQVAASSAVVTGGLLEHTLTNKKVALPAPVTVEVHDTLVVQKEAERIVERIEIERKPSFFARLKASLFWFLLPLALLGVWKIVELVKTVIARYRDWHRLF